MAAMLCKISPADRRRIAQATGVDDRYLYQCLTGRRDMEPARAVRIELAMQGEVTRFDLCQKNGAGIWPEQYQARRERAPVAHPPTPPQPSPHRAAAPMEAAHG